MRRVVILAAIGVATPSAAALAQTAPDPAAAPAPAEAPVTTNEAPVEPPPEEIPAKPEAEPGTTPAEAAATEAPTVETAWYDGIALHAFASAAYTFNTNRPDTHTNQARAFDGVSDSLTLDIAELVIEKAVGEPGSAGFRFDLTAGSLVPPLAASQGLFRESLAGPGENFDLQQAFVSWIAPVGNGLRLDVGKFMTHMGYELVEGFDGYNDHYSRSILFGYAIPVGHTGLKLSYPISDTLSAMLMVANGWDLAIDNNTGKTIGAQVIAKAGPATLYFNAIAGPEQADNNDAWRVVGDFVASASFGQLTVGLNADYGFEQEAVNEGEDSAAWYGAALYGKYALNDSWDLAGRAEYFDDPDDFRGITTSVFGATVTPSFKAGDAVVLRADFRLDVASDDIFITDDPTEPTGTQFTIALNALAHI
jgi:hypothetical protein